MADFEIRGADEFRKLSKALKDAGRTELRKELHKGVRRAARPLIPLTRAAARRRLPKRGGLAEQVAREPQRIAARTGLQTAGVAVIVGKKRGAARSANEGVIRHPVHGQDVWVEQRVPGGWFDDTIRAAAPAIRRSIERAMEDVADEIVKGV